MSRVEPMEEKVSYAAAHFFMEQCVGMVPGSTLSVNNPVLYSFLDCHIDRIGQELWNDPVGFCNFLEEVVKQLKPK